MHEIIIKEHKLPFYVGIIDVVLFSGFLFFCAIGTLPYGDIDAFLLCSIVFSIFIALGILLICIYAFRRVVLSEEICYRQTIFHRRHEFTCEEITICYSVFYAGSLQFRLYNEQQQCLAKFESAMIGVEEALKFLTYKDIPMEKRGPTSKVLKLLLPEEDNNAKKQYPSEKIKKVNTIIKFANYISLIGIVIAYMYFDLKSLLLYCACIPLLWYIVYLALYPLMAFEKNKEDADKGITRIPFPMLSTGIAFLLLISLMKITNIRSFTQLFIFIFSTSTLLFIPYLILCHKRENKTSIRKKISVFLALLFYFTASSYAWNWVCRIKAPVHETTMIQDMHKSSGGKSGTSYYLKVLRTNKEVDDVEVSSSFYKRHTKFDNVELCKRQSIFGIEYWYIHD